MQSVLQNTTRGFYIFADDSTAFGTGLAGLTITVELSKGGAAFAVVSPTITDRGDGHYWIAPIAAHRDTLGEIAWKFAGTGATIAPHFETVVAVDDQVASFGANTTTPAVPGNAMALTAGERTTLVAAVWTATTRTITDLSSSLLALFLTRDTGETAAVDGAVAKIAQGAAGGSVQVAGFDAAALAQLANISIAVVSHQASDSSLVIVQGDTYAAGDGSRPLNWTNSDGSGWPVDLTGATIQFTAIAKGESGAVSSVAANKKIVAAGAVVVATTPNQEVSVDLTSSDTDIDLGLYGYDVEAELPDGSRHTLVTTEAADSTTRLESSNARASRVMQVLRQYTK